MNGRANATEINKAPTTISFVVVVKPLGGKPIGVTSYRSLKERVDLGIEWMKVINIISDQVTEINPRFYNDFLEEWRNNYFDPSWCIPTAFQNF